MLHVYRLLYRTDQHAETIIPTYHAYQHPQSPPTWNLCMWDITMECQQPESSTRSCFPVVGYHSSLLQTVEQGITALGSPCLQSLPFHGRGSSQSYAIRIGYVTLKLFIFIIQKILIGSKNPPKKEAVQNTISSVHISQPHTRGRSNWRLNLWVWISVNCINIFPPQGRGWMHWSHYRPCRRGKPLCFVLNVAVLHLFTLQW